MATNIEMLRNINARINWVFTDMVTAIREQVLWTKFDVQGTVRPGGRTSLGTEISYLPQYLHNLQVSIDAQTKSLISALNSVSKGEPFDEAKLLAGVQSAAQAGVKAAIESIETTTTVNVKES